MPEEARELVTVTNLTCPTCAHVAALAIPENYWLTRHKCAGCGAVLRPLPGDCCVFCSYGDHHCIEQQRVALDRGRDDAWLFRVPMKGAITHPRVRFVTLVSAIALLAITGFSVFRLYTRATLPAGAGLYLLAIAAGVASLFSPCSFPLLVTLLTRQSGEGTRGELARLVGAFSLGATLFLALTGTAIALGAGVFIARFTFTSVAGRTLRVVVGLALIVFGLWQIRGRSLSASWLNRLLQPLWRRQFQWRRRRTTLSYGLYGFGYILAGFG